MNDVTAGVNWYLNPCTKVQFNYIHSCRDHPTCGDSEAGSFACRGLIDFFIDIVKNEVHDERLRDRIARAILEQLPTEEEEVH